MSLQLFVIGVLTLFAASGMFYLLLVLTAVQP